MASDALTLNVFFEGTANRLSPITTQVGLFFQQCTALDVTDPQTACRESSSFKMGFDGCGVVAGLAGVIWAVGLRDQCKVVLSRVKELLLASESQQCGLIINVLGLSRGGIAGLYLAQALATLPAAGQARLVLNLCLFDPVPGNLLCTSSWLDIFGMTVANDANDVSHCTCLKRCLAIYPCEPLPDLAFHAPILPTYPSTCEVEEDATPGCHQGAFFPPAIVGREGGVYRASLLSYHRVHSFLSQCGTSLVPADMASAHWWGERGRDTEETLVDACLEIATRELKRAQPSKRSAHQARRTATIVRHASATAHQYLNRHHRQLATEAAAQAGTQLSMLLNKDNDEVEEGQGALGSCMLQVHRQPTSPAWI